jgi:nitrate/TMAO reductase-like tetraheme cytochrome c subunit
MFKVLAWIKQGLNGTRAPFFLLGLAAGLMFLGVAFSGAFASFVQYSNTMGFCTSCHEMESTVYQEYQKSAHYMTRTGVRPVCADCHVPHNNWITMLGYKVMATKELFVHTIGGVNTREKFEAVRPELAQHVWDRMKATDSRECRHCHQTNAWDMSLQSPRARGQHESMAANGQTCIDCHKGIAHKKIKTEGDKDEDFEPFGSE